MPQTEILSLVSALRQAVPFCDAQRAGAELYGAPRMSAFHLLQPNEMRLSRVLADLLDPKGSHGQGPLFLNALLSELKLGQVPAREPVQVALEVLTGAGRRIDIVVETAKLILGIENKPWAGQQPNQLGHYDEELTRWARERKKNARLLFLSDQGGESAQGKVEKLVFFDGSSQNRSLHQVLKATLDHVKAVRARAFVEDFLAWIEAQFGDETMIEADKEPYVQAVTEQFDLGPDNRKAIAVVMLSQARLHARILDEIGDSIAAAFRRHYGDMLEMENPKLSQALAIQWNPWAIRSKTWPRNCAICIEAGKRDFKAIYYGIRALKPKSVGSAGIEDQACLERARLDILTQSIPEGSQTDWWPWQKPAAEAWNAEFTAGLLIEANGEVEEHPKIKDLAQHLLQLAQAVDEILKK